MLRKEMVLVGGALSSDVVGLSWGRVRRRKEIELEADTDLIPEEMRPVANLESFVIGDIKGHPWQTLDLVVFKFVGTLHFF